MLCDLQSRPGCHQCRTGRDVVGTVAVASGADDVDRADWRLDPNHARPHHLRRAGQLLHRLAAHAQPHQERTHLGLRRVPVGHDFERGADLVLGEGRAGRDFLDQLAEGLHWHGGLGVGEDRFRLIADVTSLANAVRCAVDLAYAATRRA